VLWICDDCTTPYSVGAPACPHCGATNYTEQGTEADPVVEEAADDEDTSSAG
jgi:hypothetical protein